MLVLPCFISLLTTKTIEIEKLGSGWPIGLRFYKGVVGVVGFGYGILVRIPPFLSATRFALGADGPGIRLAEPDNKQSKKGKG